MAQAYRLPDPLPWAKISAPVAAAEDALARLDERLAKSPIREGWIARTHFFDACATLWLEGAAVPVEDLVLHDAEMDVRAPTPELTRAHAVLRARRRILASPPNWALSEEGLQTLRGRAWEGEPRRNGAGAEPDGNDEPDADDEPEPVRGEDQDRRPSLADSDNENGRPSKEKGNGDHRGGDNGADDHEEGDPGRPLAQRLAELDAAMRSADRAVAGARSPARRPPSQEERSALVYGLDWNEDFRFAEWRRVVAETKSLPPTLAAAIAADAWESITPLEHAAWLGRLLAAALLRERGKTRAHLACLHEGSQKLPYERRRARDPAEKLVVQLEAIAAAAEAGLNAHDRWLIARTVLTKKLDNRRSSSHLPALVDYVLSRPVVSAAMIARELAVTPRAAQNLVAELGLREATGRTRYRAWGIL